MNNSWELRYIQSREWYGLVFLCRMTALLAGISLFFLPARVIAGGTAQLALTLKTHVTKSTCHLTHNGSSLGELLDVTLPPINPVEAGAGEWMGEVIPLHLGINCAQFLNGDVITLVIRPEKTGSYYTHEYSAISSVRPDGTPGPDLLIVNTANRNIPLASLQPVLAREGESCSDQGCLKIVQGPSGNWLLPLGVRIFIPADKRREAMLKAGGWQSVVTLNIAYQ